MILTPVAPDRLRRTLAAFESALAAPPAGRVFRRIAVPAWGVRARGRDAALHHRQALALAASFGMGLRRGPPQSGAGWDGRTLRTGTEAYVLLHEIAHFQLAAPSRRRRIDFGLGAGPETGDRARAERGASLDGLAREREEAMASLLGILWEAALGQPALASFLDQNWLEGAPHRGAARHFSTVLAQLAAGGFVTATGRPTRRLRRSEDAVRGPGRSSLSGPV
ncbi:MAG TPA: hypothetical protein VMU87_01575 [Stellaceae bacterium]|nr:hypothetical protein [Stellaceae bacterium]